MENSNYRVSQPISLNGVHDVTICAYSISGGISSCIELVNCYNIHITQCELVNSDQLGINLLDCTNVLIDDCYVANVSSGIHSLNGVNIQVRNNKGKQLGPQGTLVRFESNGINVDRVSHYSNNNHLE
jgi:polygalacturonase